MPIEWQNEKCAEFSQLRDRTRKERQRFLDANPIDKTLNLVNKTNNLNLEAKLTKILNSLKMLTILTILISSFIVNNSLSVKANGINSALERTNPQKKLMSQIYRFYID